MDGDCINLLRTGCVISVGLGAYLHYSYRAIIDWAWPANCQSDALAREIKALRGDMAGTRGPDIAQVPYGAVLVWSFLLVLLVVFVSKRFATEIVQGRAFAFQNGDGSGKVPRKIGTAPDRIAGDD